MSSIWPEYHELAALPASGVLAVVGFGDPADTQALSVRVPMRQLSSPHLAEVWRSGTDVVRGSREGVTYAITGSFLFGTVTVRNGGADAAATDAYARIARVIAAESHPHLVRVWNHLGGVNAEERGVERYKLFSAGRHDALTAAGYTRDRFSAASAVGMADQGLVIYFIATREAGQHVENPRQVSAYDYPPQYGKRSPSFARATVAGSLIFVAGTSSVVGHETLHAGDVSLQLDETLANLDTIIETSAVRQGRKAGLRDLTVAKTYIRRAGDYELIARGVRNALPHTAHLFVESDICRGDLLLEIEGVVRL